MVLPNSHSLGGVDQAGGSDGGTTDRSLRNDKSRQAELENKDGG